MHPPRKGGIANSGKQEARNFRERSDFTKEKAPAYDGCFFEPKQTLRRRREDVCEISV
jgi:hypothetical protein